MRKLAPCLLSALLFLAMACPAAASTFSDVPTDHWAYDAIDYLQQASLVEGYPDGTFGGARSFTRYEMAMVIARVFTKIQDWQAMYDDGSLPNGAGANSIELTEVYSRLDRLSEEFRDELSDLGGAGDRGRGRTGPGARRGRRPQVADQGLRPERHRPLARRLLRRHRHGQPAKRRGL